jgi:hypothetical protein
MATRWGYKENGEARLFEVLDDVPLPDGWSDDHMIIADEAKRTSEAITEAAGTSILYPVKVIVPVPDEDRAGRASKFAKTANKPYQPLARDDV